MLEKTILSHLVFNEDYAKKVLPYIQKDYFNDPSYQTAYDIIQIYALKYNGFPTREAMLIDLDAREGVNEVVYNQTKDLISNLSVENTDQQWLLDQTEDFCKKRALFNAIRKSITIMDGKADMGTGAIPKLLQDALAVSFDNHIGHDYLDDAEARYEYYHTPDNRIPFGIDILNKATNGGVKKKTLNMIMAPTGVGKTMIMCHLAADYLASGLNVLYITLEMAEEEIAQRIDANLLDTPMAEVATLPKDMYDKKIARIKGKTAGKLIIKEFPTASAGVGHFRHLLNELRLKKNFFPDVIFIDYLNICTSTRMKMGGSINSYNYVKSIAEEIRGLAVEFEVPIWSATQTNREGFNTTDFDMDQTSESFGLPMTLDLMWAAIRTEEMDQMNQIMFKQLKSRYDDKAKMLRFVCGLDRDKMRLYEVEQSAQDDLTGTPFITDDMEKSVFDKSAFGQGVSDEKKKKWKKILV